LAGVFSASAQVYTVGGTRAEGSQPSGVHSASGAQSLGWGSNIQNARLGRAADAALKRGDRALALTYAQRAAQAAPNDPEQWFMLGYVARLNGNFSLSVSAYQHGLRLKPSAAEGRSGLAEDYSEMGRTAEAIQLLMQIVAANPGRRDDLLFLGYLLIHTKEYDQAKQWLLKAEALQPGANPELLLAICYQNTNQLDQAHHYLEMAKRRAPNNPDVERSLAGYYREIHNYPAAIAALKAIPNPKPDVVAELAYTYQLDSDVKDAARLYLQAADADPKNFNVQLDAAQAEVSAGLIEQANSLLGRAAALNPNSYRIHAVKGDIAHLEGRDEEAVREYTAAVDSLPPNPVEGPLYGIQLHMNLVDLYRSLENPDAAKRELSVAQSQIGSVNIQEAGREAYLRLKSEIELHAGQYEQALTDVNQALTAGKQHRDDLQLKGDILMKLGRTAEALSVYNQVLKDDPDNRNALISIGYACRAAGRDRDAEKYFRRLEKVDPKSATPYLALGDLYTAHKEYSLAQQNYAKGYERNPKNAFIVAGGLNIAVESHNMPEGAVWMKRVTSNMNREAAVLREEERYLRFDHQYLQSEEVGEEAIKKLPRDRDTVVYLGYDLLDLGKYNELLALTKKYYNILPKDQDIPLLQGYVEKHYKQNPAALADFAEVIRRNPDVETAYVNRGYIMNDLHEAKDAATNFDDAIHLEPHDGDAHLGLAFADLELKDSEGALHESYLAQKYMGNKDSVLENVHEIRATAYGDEDFLSKAESEYRAALKYAPRNNKALLATLHSDLGNTLFGEQRYHRSIAQLEIANQLAPATAYNYAMLARAYANIQNSSQTMRYVHLAEQEAARNPKPTRNGVPEESDILLSTGEALSTLGDDQAAMTRYRRALDVSRKYRVGVRLAIAGLMAQRGHADEAQREIALAWMEVESGRAVPPTGSQLIAAADIFSSLHEYELSQSYLERAKTAGAPDSSVRIGLANNYLALGETNQAQAELSAISSEQKGPGDYQYLMAEAQVWSQKHQNTKAMTAFAQAENAMGGNEEVDQGMLQASGDEGMRVTPDLSLLSDFNVSPIFEDTSDYVLDSKTLGNFPVPSYDIALLPPPRSSIQTQWTDGYHLHIGKLPAPGGFVQVQNVRGVITVPATNSIVNRSTTDTTFNFGLNPTVHLGNNIFTFSGGTQATIRRDSLDPVGMDQNLFRVYAYLSTSALFNEVTVNGYAIRESGPFTRFPHLHSRMLAGELNFRVGTPWSKTALLTGWGVDDQWYPQINTEYYFSSSYIGISHTFSPRLNFSALMQDVRAWRGYGPHWGIAQDIVPTGNVDFKPAKDWDLNFSGYYSNNRGFHVYDAVENGISVTYAWPFRRMLDAASGSESLEYPIRFSGGLQEETFFNFPGSQGKQFRPYFEISIF
jgi:tetratricopeptide (TPR) repeat protein